MARGRHQTRGDGVSGHMPFPRLLLLTVALLAACQPSPTAPTQALAGLVLAGPVCPVVTDPPDPACADRPVSGAVLVVRDLEAVEVARATSDADGAFSVDLPPGRYVVEPQPVDGLMGTAAPAEVTVAADADAVPEPIVIMYDTGIR